MQRCKGSPPKFSNLTLSLARRIPIVRNYLKTLKLKTMILQRLPDEGGHSTVLIGFSVESISFPVSEEVTILLDAKRNIMRTLAFLVFGNDHDLSLTFDSRKKKNVFVNLCTYGLLKREELLRCLPHTAFLSKPLLTQKVNLIFLAYAEVDKQEIPSGIFPMDVRMEFPCSWEKTGKLKSQWVYPKLFSDHIPTTKAKHKP